MNSGKQSTNLQMTLREVNRVGEVKKNVPKLRFKGYEDSWEQRKLGTIITVHPSKDLIVEAVEDEGRSIVVQQGDSPILGYSNAEGFEGYINVTIFGDHTVSLYKPQLPFVVATDGVKILSSSILQHQYFYTVLEKYKPIPQGYKRHFSILKEQIANITVNKDEQKKIGEFFETIGDLITLHQRKYDALKSMKKTLLSKMFPKNGEDVPEIRFKGFTDAWEQRRLEEIFLKIRNAFVGTSTPYYVEKNQGGHFYIESNNVKHGKINHDTEVFINEEFYQNQKDKWLKTGDIVMVQSGHVGHSAVIPEYLNNSTAHALIMFQEYKIETNPYFINFQFQTESVRNKIDSITTGNTIKHILASDMKLFSISNTQKKEADKLGDFFISLDNLITLHQRKLDELKNMKKTLLQQMFV